MILRLKPKINSEEFARRVRDLVKTYNIKNYDAVSIVRDFEHSYFVDDGTAVEWFKSRIYFAQKRAKRKKNELYDSGDREHVLH